MKKFLTVLIIGLLVMTGCKSKDEVLATFEGGNVQRGEMQTFYEVRNIKPGAESANRENQTKVVEEIGVYKLASLENEKDPTISEKDFEIIMKELKPQFLLVEFRKNFLESLKTEAMLKMAFPRVVLLAKGADGQPKTNRAQQLMEELNQAGSESEIETLIAENTDEKQRQSVGGILEPTCMNCGMDPLAKQLIDASKNPGQFIQMQTPNGDIFLISVDEVVPVYPNRVALLFQDRLNVMKEKAEAFTKREQVTEEEKQNAAYYLNLDVEKRALESAEHYLNRFNQFHWQQEFKKLAEQSGLKVNTEVFNEPEKIQADTVLHTLKDGTTYTYGELMENYKIWAPIIEGPKSLSMQVEKEDALKLYSQTLIQIEIAKHNPDVMKVAESESFEKAFPIIRNYMLWRLMQAKISAGDVTVSPEEIRSNYEAGKMYAYSTPSPADPNKRIPKSFFAVQAQIKQELESSKRQSLIRDFRSNLLSKYKFKVLTEKLVPGTI